MNALVQFQFEQKEDVRVVIIDDEPWWIATDLAALLGYAHAPNMVRMLREREKGVHSVNTNRGPRQLTIISESGMWKAVLRSKRPEAEQILDWLTGEVLPAIRKTGRYELPDDPPQAPIPAGTLDLARLNAAIRVVEAGKSVWSGAELRALWAKVGLPAPFDDGTPVVDDFPARIRAALAGKTVTTQRELATALDLPMTGETQVRIAQALRLLGWSARAERINGRKENAWRSSVNGAGEAA